MRRTCLLALVLATTLSGTAHAEQVAKVDTFSADLQVVGEGAAWSQIRCLRGCLGFPTERVDLSRFVLKPLGEPLDELARVRRRHFPGGSNSIIENVSYSASTAYVAKLEQDEITLGDETNQEARLVAGPLGSPLSAVVTCAVFDLPHALDADRLAYDETVCVDGSTNVVVQPLAGGAPATVPTEGRFVQALALTGPFVAVAARDKLAAGDPGPATGAITVWNWRTATKVSEVALGAGLGTPPIDVNGAGSLAFIADGEECADGTGRLNVFAPGDAAPREVATGVCERAVWDDTDIVTRRSTQLIAVNAAGAERTLLEQGGVTLAGFDAAGGRLAYALPTCGGDTVIELVALSSPERSGGSARCPVSLPRQRLKIGPKRRVRVRVNCNRGCAGTVKFKKFGEKSFEQDRSRKVRLRLPRKLAGRARVTVVVETVDRSERRHKRSRRLRLVRG